MQPASPPTGPPSRLLLLAEARVVVEACALALELPRLRRTVPRGRGEGVMVIPGFASGDPSTFLLRRFLCSLGYDARGWGLGRNSGKVPALLPRLGERVELWAAASGSAVRLVGWSLGGYLAREVARERPAVVARVVTLGSPVVGGPKYTAAASWYRRHRYDLDAIEAQVAEREARALSVPVAAVYSRRDGIVAWPACIDRHNAVVTHHEVTASHLGMVVSPRVFTLVARLLRGAGGSETTAAGAGTAPGAA